MDIHTRFKRAVQQTGRQVKKSHDALGVVHQFLITQSALSKSEGALLFMSQGKRTKADETIFIEIIQQSTQNKRKG
jgi:hypothetical protein